MQVGTNQPAPGLTDAPTCRSVSGAAAKRNYLVQGIFSCRPRPLSDLSIPDRDLKGISRRGNREIGGPEQRISAAEQEIKAAPHHAFSGVNESAVCNAIAANFAAFEPAALAMTMTGRSLGGRKGERCGPSVP
jgi:hypothetical protein